jgi:hypothetical protein
MSFLDAPPEKTAFQNDNFRNFGMPILFFGGFAYAIWTFSQYMWRTASDGTKTVSTLSKKPESSVTFSGGAVPSDSAGIQGLVDAQRSGKNSPLNVTPSTEAQKQPPENEGSGNVSVMPVKGDSAAKAKGGSEWKMHGVIYDLITLKPVPGVHMVFTDNMTSLRVPIDADSQGRYRALLPLLVGRGYIVTMSKPGYKSTYLDPGIEGVTSLPLERRRELVRDLSSLISQPYLFEPDSGAPLVADFYLPPQ